MNICFIGGGNMANALIGGMLARGFAPADITVVEINSDSRAKLVEQYAVRVADNLLDGRGGRDGLSGLAGDDVFRIVGNDGYDVFDLAQAGPPRSPQHSAANSGKKAITISVGSIPNRSARLRTPSAA